MFELESCNVAMLQCCNDAAVTYHLHDSWRHAVVIKLYWNENNWRLHKQVPHSSARNMHTMLARGARRCVPCGSHLFLHILLVAVLAGWLRVEGGAVSACSRGATTVPTSAACTVATTGCRGRRNGDGGVGDYRCHGNCCWFSLVGENRGFRVSLVWGGLLCGVSSGLTNSHHISVWTLWVVLTYQIRVYSKHLPDHRRDHPDQPQQLQIAKIPE